jgi:SAM-dependent methyltransferase
MGFYEDAVLPRIVDKLGRVKPVRRLRDEVVQGLRGEVVEIGFGSGLNLSYLPAEVDKVLAVEPSEVARRLATPRIAASSAPVELVGLDGEDLPIETESVDSALSTLTLCTIPDVSRALAEVHRVLRPGGLFHFFEHGLSPKPRVARWQHRLTPLQRRICGGCHFDRPIDTLISNSGLEITTLRNPSLGGPKFAAYIYLGTARKS